MISLIMFSCISGAAMSQFYYMQSIPRDGHLVGLKFHKTLNKNIEYSSYLPGGMSAVYNVYGNIKLNDLWRLNVEVPFVIAKYDEYPEDNQNGLANIYVGLQKIVNESGTKNVAFGIYFPTIGNEGYSKSEVGAISNFYHLTQYVQGVNLYFNFAHHRNAEKGAILGYEIGSDIAIPTESGSDVEFFLHYAANGGYNMGFISLWTEFSGIMILSEEAESFTDRWINQLSFCGQLSKGRFNPGVFYTLFLKKWMREEYNGVLGVKIDYNF